MNTTLWILSQSVRKYQWLLYRRSREDLEKVNTFCSISELFFFLKHPQFLSSCENISSSFGTVLHLSGMLGHVFEIFLGCTFLPYTLWSWVISFPEKNPNQTKNPNPVCKHFIKKKKKNMQKLKKKKSHLGIWSTFLKRKESFWNEWGMQLWVVTEAFQQREKHSCAGDKG